MLPDKNQILRFIEYCLPEFTPTGIVSELSGGNLNMVWRIDGDPGSVIAKHAPPYIAASPDVPMNSNRISFEARALKSFMPSGLLSGIHQETVQPPVLLGYEAEASLLVMEDISPSVPWFKALRSGRADIDSATDLGSFIGELHSISYDKPVFAKQFDNQPVQETRYRVQYLSLSEALFEMDSEQSQLAADRCSELGRRLLGAGRCLLMGDLWPPSLLWSRNKIRIIDWEFAHYGRPLQDLAHFCAHCMMHKAVASPGKEELYHQIWMRMVEGYKEATGRLYTELMNSEEIGWFPVHTGAEILARTIGAFSGSYLFKDQRQNILAGKLVQEAINLMSGKLPGKHHPYIRLIYM